MYLVFEDGSKMHVGLGQRLAGIKRRGSRPIGYVCEDEREKEDLKVFFQTWKNQMLLPAMKR